MSLSRISRFLDVSIPFGRIAGVPVRLHVTILFFLLPAFVGQRLGFGHAIEWAFAVVLSILLHELGHALTARRFGLTGLSITLHGFGGFASSSGARTPRQSLLISLAGPAVTFAIGVFGLVVGSLGMEATPLASEAWVQSLLLRGLGSLNVLLGFLNLIPSLPWDGGRALEATLAHRLSGLKATRAVSHLGLVLCPLLFVWGMASSRDYLELFSIIGALTSYLTLARTGGVRFGEALADWRSRKELEAVRKREAARNEAYLDEVRTRQAERDERERLRRLFERSGIDDQA